MKQPIQIPPGEKIRLADFDPDHTGNYKDKDEAKAETEKNIERMAELQEGALGDGGKEFVQSGEVVVRRRVRDAGGARHFAQRQPGSAVLRQQLVGSVQQFLAQVAVVVGLQGWFAAGHGAILTRETLRRMMRYLSLEKIGAGHVPPDRSAQAAAGV